MKLKKISVRTGGAPEAPPLDPPLEWILEFTLTHRKNASKSLTKACLRSLYWAVTRSESGIIREGWVPQFSKTSRLKEKRLKKNLVGGGGEVLGSAHRLQPLLITSILKTRESRNKFSWCFL